MDSRTKNKSSVESFINANRALQNAAIALMEIAVGAQADAPIISESVYKFCVKVAGISLSSTAGYPTGIFGSEVILPLYAYQMIENISHLTTVCVNLEIAGRNP